MSDFSRFIQRWNGRPDFRKRVLDGQKEKYHTDDAVKEAKRRAARERYVPTGVKPHRRPNRPRVIAVDGVDIVLLGLGESANRLGVTKQTLRVYDETHIIPRNRIVDGQKRRWYPEPFIEFLKPLLAEQGRRRLPLWRLKQEVEGAWAKAEGIPRLSEETSHGEEDSAPGERVDHRV